VLYFQILWNQLSVRLALTDITYMWFSITSYRIHHYLHIFSNYIYLQWTTIIHHCRYNATDKDRQCKILMEFLSYSQRYVFFLIKYITFIKLEIYFILYLPAVNNHRAIKTKFCTLNFSVKTNKCNFIRNAVILPLSKVIMVNCSLCLFLKCGLCFPLCFEKYEYNWQQIQMIKLSYSL
jgi:hypothetical protein